MAEIALTQGQVTIVDACDYEWLSQWKWHAYLDKNTWYAKRNTQRNPKTGKRRSVSMHRELLSANPGQQVDHVDGDGLNNQRENLRICSNVQNLMNQRKRRGTSSQYIGVSWHKQREVWRANIKLNGRYIHLGYFLDEIEAAETYDSKARELHGEFGTFNFPREGEQSALERGA